MSISKINNGLSFSKTPNFGSEPFELHKLDDETLYDIASYDAKRRLTEISKKSVKTVLIGVPIADALVSGVAHNGQLASKLSKSASVLGRWGMIFAAGAAVLGAKFAINSQSKTLDNFDRNHRFLSFGVDIGALYGALTLCDKVGVKISSTAKKLAPKMTKTFSERVSQPLKSALNNSVVNHWTVKPFEKFLTNHHHYNAALKTFAVFLAPTIALAAIFRFNKEVNTASDSVESNFIKLKAINDLLPDKE